MNYGSIKIMRLKILIITLFITAPLLANAKIYIYVTDQVSIPMRSENEIQSRLSNVLKMLPSGAELEILSTKNGWTQIKYKNQTGWIMSRYLTARPPAIVQLEELKKIYNDSNSLSEMKVDIKISNKVTTKYIQVSRVSTQSVIFQYQFGGDFSKTRHILL
jgi:uncharacterized protein YgiM (DUF1202 family)